MKDPREMTDDELIDRAVRAYLRRARRSATPARQPNLACCEVRGNQVILANAHQTLAKYRVGKTRLTRLNWTVADINGASLTSITARLENAEPRYNEVLTALEAAGFAVAQLDEPHLWVVPFTGSKTSIPTSRLNSTAGCLVDRHDLIRQYVLRGKGSVPVIVAHFTSRWENSNLPFESDDVA